MISRYDFIWPKIYPICIIAVAFATGIWWQSYCFTLFQLIAAIIAILVIGILYAFKSNNRGLVLLALCTCVAFGAGAFRYQMLINNQKKFHEITDNKTFTIKGRIIDYRKTGKPYPSHRMILHIETLENKCEKIIVDAPILIFLHRMK